MSWKTRKIFFKRIFGEVGRKVNSYEGKPVPNDQVASGGRKNIGSVGSGFDNVQRDSKSSKTLHQILNIGWEGGGVPGGIGTCPVGNKCLIDQFPVQRCFAQRLGCF